MADYLNAIAAGLILGGALAVPAFAADPEPSDAAAAESHASGDRATPVGTDQSEPSALTLRYDGAHLSATIENARLEEVAVQLERTTGAKITIAREDLRDLPLSASVESLPLEAAMDEIFSGFSYVIAQTPGMEQLQLFIRARDGSGLSADAPDSNRALNGSDVPMDSADSADAEIEQPWDLEEFRPLERIESAARPAVLEAEFEEDEEFDEFDAEEAEAARREHELARVERALAALESGHESLRRDALDELVGRKDERATEALSQAALGIAEGDSDARFSAAESLVNHAADLQFQDTASIAAIRWLAEDEDPAIRELAEWALTGMERFLKQQERQ